MASNGGITGSWQTYGSTCWFKNQLTVLFSFSNEFFMQFSRFLMKIPQKFRNIQETAALRAQISKQNEIPLIFELLSI
jgi:hypothetical protein